MLTLSLATLLVPAFGWLLLQELEQFLRQGQQQALSDSARTVARSFPGQFETLLFGREQVLPLRTPGGAPGAGWLQRRLAGSRTGAAVYRRRW